MQVWWTRTDECNWSSLELMLRHSAIMIPSIITNFVRMNIISQLENLKQYHVRSASFGTMAFKWKGCLPCNNKAWVSVLLAKVSARLRSLGYS